MTFGKSLTPKPCRFSRQERYFSYYRPPRPPRAGETGPWCPAIIIMVRADLPRAGESQIRRRTRMPALFGGLDGLPTPYFQVMVRRQITSTLRSPLSGMMPMDPNATPRVVDCNGSALSGRGDLLRRTAVFPRLPTTVIRSETRQVVGMGGLGHFIIKDS